MTVGVNCLSHFLRQKRQTFFLLYFLQNKAFLFLPVNLEKFKKEKKEDRKFRFYIKNYFCK